MRKVTLKTEGKLWDKNVDIPDNCVVSIVGNPTIKEHKWKIERICFHQPTGDFATADERGQVYSYSVLDNSYSFVRLASTPVSAIEYIQCRKSHLIIAYRHGSIIVVDTSSKSVVAHIQLPRPSTITLIRCHQSIPIATMVAADGEISMWDLR